MKKNLLTKHCTLLLLALAAAWSTQAWAGIKIYVRTEGSAAGTAPNLYVWDQSREPINGAWPGTQMSETTTTSDGTSWYVKEFDASNIGVIINNYNGQTPDLEGINEDRYYSYKGGSEYYNLTNQYVIPGNATYIEGKKFIYFVNTSEWSTPHAHVYNSNGNITGSWPGEPMTKVDNTVNLWKWEKSTSENPANIIFNDGGSSQSSTMTYSNGGYYNAAEIITTITEVLLNSTNFPDANFRASLAEQLNANEGDNIYPNNVKVLNVSNKGISNLTGIAHFTNLEELYVQDNNLTSSVDLKNNKKLQILNISGNSAITGFSANHTPYVDINFGNGNPTTNLKELYCANCAIFYAGGLQYNVGLKVLSMPHNVLDYFDATNTMSKLSNLEYLDMSYNKLTSQQSLSHNPKLVYVDVSENPTFNSYFANLNNLTQLKTFKAANCKLTANQTKYVSSTNYFPNENVEYVDVSNNPALNTMYVPATNNLKTIIANGCTGLGGSSSSLALSPTSGGTYLPRLTHLERLELNNVDLYLNTSNQTYGLFNILTPSVATNLNYIDLSNDQLGTSSKPTFAFPKLETLLLNGNPGLTQVTVTDLESPENFQLDVTGDASLTSIAINNSGLTSLPTITSTGATSLYKLDLTDNAFTDVPTTGISTLTTLVMNNNQLSDINVSESNIHYLYAQNNNFGNGDYTLPTTSLVGLDLGNNGFTKFKAENNTSLKSLALAGNTNLTEIELHGNTALTQTSPDGIIENDNGLYIKGLSNLKVLNIENSKFNKLGQQNSLEGVTALETLKARHNELTTFTNGVYELHTSSTDAVNYRKPDPTQSSLEYQTSLKYLDLSHNLLRDSVHLYRNTALVHLDVSYNRSIDGQLDPAAEPLPKSEDQKAAILEQKGRRWMKYGRVGGKTYGVNATPGQWDTHYTLQSGRLRPFDLRKSEAVCDLNDTTGLYHLDLGKNVNLEWLDISYTNIHNTSAGPTHMNPGWMNEDWVGDDDLSATNASGKNTTGRWYSSWHSFVYFIPCTKLKVIHADHNNMRSLGVRYFPDLDTLTCSYMYGDSELMRDYQSGSSDMRYGMGNTGTSTKIKKFHHVDWDHLDSDGYPTMVLWGPNNTTAESDVYQNKLRYWDLSYSGFNEIRLYPGVADNGSLPYLEHVNVSGNPLNFTTHASNANYATTSNWNSLDVTYCPNIRTVLAENCSDLPIVRAHNRTKLDTLYVSNDPNLKVLYVQNDPLLKTNFSGLNTLTGLETLFGYNNTQWGGIDVSNNTALKNLWISNIGASAIDVSKNTALEKLRVYDNSLQTLNVGTNTALTWLDLARNQVPNMDLSANSALQYFNCSNSEETLDDQSLAANSHNGGEADEVKPVSGTAKANNGGNSLSDLVFHSNIVDVRANYNDLHCIKPGTNGSFANLTKIEFAHNHINGIDLSAATGSPTINSEDNGRAITAECAKFYQHGQFPLNEVTVFYFQLEDINSNGQTIDNSQPLASKTSEDSKGTTRYLGQDGFILDELNAWDSSNSAEFIPTNPSGISPRDVTVDPNNMNQYLTEVPGRIVVLQEDSSNPGEGRATYTYNNGKGESEFYLDWTADTSIPTAIESIKIIDGLNIVNTADGGITITGKDGIVVGVYDLNGRQVASETITGGKAVITGLTPGIYLVNGMKVLVK